MPDTVFVDTNIFIYAVSGHGDSRSATASRLIQSLLMRDTAAVSYQVVQEFLNVVLRKFTKTLPPELAQAYVSTVFAEMRMVHSSLRLYSEAINLTERYQISWYDSLIVAAACEAGCSILYSEDMQHGMQFGGVRVENPFLESEPL